MKFNGLVSKTLSVISDVTDITTELSDACKGNRSKNPVYQGNASIVHFPLFILAKLAA